LGAKVGIFALFRGLKAFFLAKINVFCAKSLWTKQDFITLPPQMCFYKAFNKQLIINLTL